MVQNRERHLWARVSKIWLLGDLGILLFCAPQDLMVLGVFCARFPPREAKYFDNNQQPHTPSFMKRRQQRHTVPPTPRRGHPQLSPAVVAPLFPTTWCF
jgi:hypothetical protein